VLLVAHRTPASAARCAGLAAAGADVFEVDVQLRAGRIAVSHFLALPGGRLQRDNWRLRWHTAAARDPALAEVDAVVPPGCAVLLDVKESRPDRRRSLLEALAASLPREPRYVVCSPFPGDLEQARAAGFRTWRTLRNPRELAAGLGGGRLPDEAISVRHSLLTAAVVARLHEISSCVVAWTVNDPRRAEQLRSWGVDGITTDRRALIRRLAERE
jgi:glycerophosphoryl diester phosphodiesterase